VMTTPWPMSIRTCDVVTPGLTSTTLPLSWLRALSLFMSSSLVLSRDSLKPSSKRHILQNIALGAPMRKSLQQVADKLLIVTPEADDNGEFSAACCPAYRLALRRIDRLLTFSVDRDRVARSEASRSCRRASAADAASASMAR